MPKTNFVYVYISDIGNASESLKPGAAQPQERPGTVPKAKSRFDYAGQF